MGKLDGKVALITGSGRGLGKEIALTMAREGAEIIIDDIIPGDIEKTTKEIEGLGRRAMGIAADVSRKGEVQDMVARGIAKFGKIDILVNNAGIPGRASLLEMSEEIWDRVLDIDLKGAFLCTQAVAPGMIQRRYGKIVNVSSVEGMGGSIKSSANYTAAKAGMIQMTKTHARELGGYGINVNCIAPGGIITPMTYLNRSEAEIQQHIATRPKLNCLERIGKISEVANLVLFLVSDDASYITAQNIACDGGRFDRM
ncbi:MAG: glucose 1-dehydrogenase [Chloroflexi bacterium]|nr:glucose 1-dehydrogenase [Chloroflexota bacterium]